MMNTIRGISDLRTGAQTSLFEFAPYASQLEFVEGLRRAIEARMTSNELLYDMGDPPCPLLPAKSDDSELAGEFLEKSVRARELHDARVRAGREAGVKLPLDRLVEKHELDKDDRRLLETLLVLVTTLSRSRRLLTCGTLARAAADWNPGIAQGFLSRFLADSRLRGSGLLSVSTRDPAPTDWPVAFEKDVLADLLRPETARKEDAADKAPEAPPGDIVRWLAGAGVELTPVAARDIATLWSWVTCGEVIFREWGFGKADHAPAGIRLLFHGPPGTGKTLTAKALARALGRDCEVVACSEILDKYIGETEKNITRCFAEAAAKNSILLFDEADVLFGRRGDVARAGDRLINAEVNTALVGLEQFGGVCILTTNYLDLLDPAVLRRARWKVHFGPPEAETRARIWRAHLPPAAPLADDVDIGRLAAEYALTGGQIANAALAAAARAAGRADDGPGRVITMADLEAGAAQEAAVEGRLAGLSSPLGF